MEIGLSVVLGLGLSALMLILLVYSAVRLALKHDRRSRETVQQRHGMPEPVLPERSGEDRIS
jgi:hypothetical protein